MSESGTKRFYIVFFSLFIIVGLGLSVYGFVKLANYKLAKEIDATVISAKYDYENDKLKVFFEFELNGERLTASGIFTDIKYKDGKLPYYEGLQTKIHLNNKNEIVRYGVTEIIITVSGGIFALFGGGFLYVFVLKKQNFTDMAYSYEQAMVNPEDLSDDTAKYEAEADRLSKLPVQDITRKTGEIKIWKSRISDRFKSFSVAENVIYSVILAGLIAVFWVVFKLGPFGVFFGLLTFGFGGLFIKAIYNAYVKLLIKLGKFNQRKFATVKVCAFESEGSFQTGELSRNYIVYKKFRVVAVIDGKRSVGYVYGNVPPPKGCVLKVLVRPRNFKRFIIDDTDVKLV